MADELNRRNFSRRPRWPPGRLSSRRAARMTRSTSAGSASARAATRRSTGCTPPRPMTCRSRPSATPTRATSRAPRIACRPSGATRPKTYKDYRELLADKIHRRRLHHDARAPASRYGDRGAARPASTSTWRSRWPTPSKRASTSSRRGRSPSKICQVGTQNRSSSLYKKAKELVQQGMIGDVHYVRAFWYRNSAAQRSRLALRDPRRGHIRRTPIGTSSWAPRPSAPGTRTATSSGASIGTTRAASRPTCWCTRPTSSTSCCDKTVPKTLHGVAAAFTAGPIRPTTATCPTRFSAIYEYPDKFQLNYSCYFGNDHYGYGEQIVRQRRHHRGDEPPGPVLHAGDATIAARPPRQASRRAQPIHINGQAGFQGSATAPSTTSATSSSAMLGKEQPIAPPPVGQQAAISGHMATLSFKNQKKIVWDDAAQQSTTSCKPARSPWPPSPPAAPAARASLPLDHRPRCGSHPGHRQRGCAGYLYLLLFTALHVKISLPVVVLERGLRRHPHLRHASAARTSIAKRARATASCSSAACCSSFRWAR